MSSPPVMAVPTTMKALVYDSSGRDSMLWMNDYHIPKLSKNEVLIKVISSSLNPFDYRVAQNTSMFIGFRGKPVGSDVAGEVIAVGKNVESFAPGDKVFGWGHGLAEFAISDPTRLAKIPTGMNTADFGIYPCVSVTAYQLLHKYWLSKSGYQLRSLLVSGASGGVGSSVIQIARALGGPELKIHAVCSNKHTQYCQSLGANEAYDYMDREFEVARILPTNTVDMIVDLVSGTPEGMDYVEGAKLLLKENGKYLTLNTLSKLEYVGSWFTHFTGIEFRNKQYEFFVVDRDNSNSDLIEISSLIAQGKFKLEVAQEIMLEESKIREAFNVMQQRHMRGKIKVVVEPGSGKPQVKSSKSRRPSL